MMTKFIKANSVYKIWHPMCWSVFSILVFLDSVSVFIGSVFGHRFFCPALSRVHSHMHGRGRGTEPNFAWRSGWTRGITVIITLRSRRFPRLEREGVDDRDSTAPDPCAQQLAEEAGHHVRPPRPGSGRWTRRRSSDHGSTGRKRNRTSIKGRAG
jgi:hypothetical protein